METNRKNLGANLVKMAEGFRLADHFILRLTEDSTQTNVAASMVLPSPQSGELRKIQQVVLYGKSIIYDIEKEELGVKKSRIFAQNIGLADFLQGPNFEAVDLSEYNGRRGSRIGITVTHDFLVTALHVKIVNSVGRVADEGFAEVGLFSTDWTFTSNRDHIDLGSDKIIITATNLADGNTQMAHLL